MELAREVADVHDADLLTVLLTEQGDSSGGFGLNSDGGGIKGSWPLTACSMAVSCSVVGARSGRSRSGVVGLHKRALLATA